VFNDVIGVVAVGMVWGKGFGVAIASTLAADVVILGHFALDNLGAETVVAPESEILRRFVGVDVEDTGKEPTSPLCVAVRGGEDGKEVMDGDVLSGIAGRLDVAVSGAGELDYEGQTLGALASGQVFEATGPAFRPNYLSKKP
jgi:hypothetical protein